MAQSATCQRASRRLAEAGRRRAVNRFTDTAMAARTFDVYREALGAGRGVAPPPPLNRDVQRPWPAPPLHASAPAPGADVAWPSERVLQEERYARAEGPGPAERPAEAERVPQPDPEPSWEVQEMSRD